MPFYRRKEPDHTQIFAPFGDPTRAYQRMILANRQKLTDKMSALFNPEQLSMSIEVSIGRLKPVGWSHPIKMYGSTGEWKIPLKLRFSQFGIWVRGFEYPNISRAMNWLSKFVYSPDLGGAPDHLLIVWPNVLTISCALDSLNITHTQFDKELNARVTDVDLGLGEVRVGFKDRDQQLQDGFVENEEAFRFSNPQGETLLGGAGTGKPLNLGRRK
jgi:hypothetical protein